MTSQEAFERSLRHRVHWVPAGTPDLGHDQPVPSKPASVTLSWRTCPRCGLPNEPDAGTCAYCSQEFDE